MDYTGRPKSELSTATASDKTVRISPGWSVLRLTGQSPSRRRLWGIQGTNNTIVVFRDAKYYTTVPAPAPEPASTAPAEAAAATAAAAAAEAAAVAAAAAENTPDVLIEGEKYTRTVVPETNVLQDPLTLKQVLQDSTARAAFKLFAETQLSSENILFWHNAEEIKTIPSLKDTYYLKKRVKQVYTKYCGENAKLQVNLPGDMLAEIKAAMGNPDPRIFVAAQEEVVSMMESDVYARYLRTDEGKTSIAALIARLRNGGAEAGVNTLTVNNENHLFIEKDKRRINRLTTA